MLFQIFFLNLQRKTIKSGGNTVKTAKEIMITLDLQKRIKKAAKEYTSIEDLLVYVNDQCEWYELPYGRTMYAIDLAKKYFNEFHKEDIEEKVYNVCKKQAQADGDTGVEFSFEDVAEVTGKELGLTKNETKGYIGSLVKKNKVEAIKGACYFDFMIK